MALTEGRLQVHIAVVGTWYVWDPSTLNVFLHVRVARPEAERDQRKLNRQSEGCTYPDTGFTET